MIRNDQASPDSWDQLEAFLRSIFTLRGVTARLSFHLIAVTPLGTIRIPFLMHLRTILEPFASHLGTIWKYSWRQFSLFGCYGKAWFSLDCRNASGNHLEPIFDASWSFEFLSRGQNWSFEFWSKGQNLTLGVLSFGLGGRIGVLSFGLWGQNWRFEFWSRV